MPRMPLGRLWPTSPGWASVVGLAGMSGAVRGAEQHSFALAGLGSTLKRV